MNLYKGDNVMMVPPIVFSMDAVKQLMFPAGQLEKRLRDHEHLIAWHLAKCEGRDMMAVVDINFETRHINLSQNPGAKFCDSYLIANDSVRVAIAALRRLPTGNYCVYRHYPAVSLESGTSMLWAEPNTNLARDGFKSYVGVTGRGWATRFHEHLEKAKAGSSLLFHAALRGGINENCESGVRMLDILALGLTKDEAYALEAKYISELSLYPMGYNMVPGGKAGHQLIDRFLPGRTTPENRERRLEELVASRENPFKHLTDDEYASVMTRIVCNNPNNFSVEEIREINLLATLGWADTDIADRLGVCERRIAKVVSGRTYKMVRL